MNTPAKVTTGPRPAKGHPNGGGDAAAVYRLTTTRRLVPRASERRSKMIAFGYYGGKFSHLDFILPLLPTHFTHYCEVFGGSAAVLINRPPAPVETYNDLDGEVVNFFECLRDHGKDLVRLTEMAGAVSRWLGSVEGLSEIVQRLQRVQIENAPAHEVILRYDSPETLFYCDPPYPHESRGDSKAYGYEMTDAEHEQLARLLRTVRGAVALSSYRCALMDRLYGDWHRVDADTRLCNSSKGERTESLWTNYDPSAAPFPRTVDAAGNPYLLDRKARKPAHRNGSKK